ncbi:hypothetical protein [Butyrivibrio sp. YAB3001]|uniref:hypothetical protein n=1 Tax=Butyrivibrio sp. YAB3001 TaxID=1520812 RepID=UPI0008F6883C|nr:hypothetical protein [Butyrivibrio sp. YAB3001]SFC12695.1 hypothetical protein SAMN02910398_01587 [Butyrivibrio sp. YAB3001]
MEKLEKKIVTNGMKKAYELNEKVSPELSAIHTKLWADGLELSPELIYLLGDGYSRKIADDRLILFNDTFLNDLSGSLGIYLEDYEENSEESFYQAIKKNSAINIAPPMISVEYPEGEYLSIVCGVFDDHTYNVISPVDKDVVRVDKTRVACRKPWYMMNSPRFIKPVFRDRSQLIKEALLRILKRRDLENTSVYRKIYETDSDKVLEKAVLEMSRKDVEDRKLFYGAMMIAEEFLEDESLKESLEEYRNLLSSMEEGFDTTQIKQLFELEDKLMDGMREVLKEESAEYDS